MKKKYLNPRETSTVILIKFTSNYMLSYFDIQDVNIFIWIYIFDSKEEKCEIINNLKRNFRVYFDLLEFKNPRIIKTLYIYYLYLNTPKQTVLLTNFGNKLY